MTKVLPGPTARRPGGVRLARPVDRESLTNDLLNAGLTFYLVLAVVHSAFPVWLQRRRGVSAASWDSQLFPPLALVLVLIPIFQLTEISFVVWPIVLLVDLLAIGLAVLTASLLSGAGGAAPDTRRDRRPDLQNPGRTHRLPTPFFLIGVFAVFFVAVSVWLARKLKPEALTKASSSTRTSPAGKPRGATADPLRRAAIPAADHGHAAAAAGESVACIRPGVAAGGPAAGSDETLLASTGCLRSAWPAWRRWNPPGTSTALIRPTPSSR